MTIMAHDSDVELLRAWQNGDTQAGQKLFKGHLGSMQRFFRNKVDASDEDDLIQETFLGCLKNAASFRGEASFRTFLFQVAKKKLIDHVRAKARRLRAVDHEVNPDEITVSDIAPGLSTIQARNRQQALLLEALRTIPLNDQIVLELFYWEDLSGPEIGAVLDLREPAVRSRLRRARERLDEQLERLARTPAELTITLEGLERWAAEIRDQMGREAPDEPTSL
jgi:RNA polymerase sigma factor (sigma-70 family)